MKILHLISGGDVGGAKTHVLTLLEGLQTTDEASLVCFTEGPFAEEARGLGIPTRVISGGVRAAVKALAPRLREEGFQLIHCHGGRANTVGALLKRRVSLPVVTTVHSDWKLDYLGRPLAAVTFGNVNKWALKRLDYHIGVSGVIRNLLLARGFPPDRVFTIYNGVRFPARTPALDREAFLRRVGFTPAEGLTVCGIAARLNPVKDMGTLIRGFGVAADSRPGLRLIIAGEGEQRQELEELAASLCPGKAAFAGWLTDTDSFYNALDVNLLTSLSEGFPYALPEGAVYRCATVATRVGGVPHLIDDGINGLLIEPGDVEALAVCIGRLADDPALRRTYGEALHQKVKEQFSVEATVAAQREIYRRILEQ